MRPRCKEDDLFYKRFLFHGEKRRSSTDVFPASYRAHLQVRSPHTGSSGFAFPQTRALTIKCTHNNLVAACKTSMPLPNLSSLGSGDPGKKWMGVFQKVNKHPKQRDPKRVLRNTLWTLNRWYHMTNHNTPPLRGETWISIGSYDVYADNNSVRNVLPVIANEIFDAVDATSILPCATNVRTLFMSEASIADDAVHETLCQMLEQIGLGCSIEMAYFYGYVYASRRGAMNSSVHKSAAGLVEFFDNSSLKLAVHAMNPQEKCMMLAGIIAMNELVDCGFDFNWRIDTLQTVLDLASRRESTIILQNEDNRRGVKSVRPHN